MMRDMAAIQLALEDFVNCVSQTGGVNQQSNGLLVPCADPEWVDLGEAYVKACKALKVDPIINMKGDEL